MQRKPRSLASRTVVLTQTSVVTPETNNVSMPRLRRIEFEIGLVERALARLVDHRLVRQRIKLGNDVVAGLAADQDAAHRAAGADAVVDGSPRSTLCGGASDISGRWPSRVWMTSMPKSRAAASSFAGRARRLPGAATRHCPSASPNPPGSRKSRCMSMMIRAALSRSTDKRSARLPRSRGACATPAAVTKRAVQDQGHQVRRKVMPNN